MGDGRKVLVFNYKIRGVFCHLHDADEDEDEDEEDPPAEDEDPPVDEEDPLFGFPLSLNDFTLLVNLPKDVCLLHTFHFAPLCDTIKKKGYTRRKDETKQRWDLDGV